MRNAYKIMIGNPERKRVLGKSRCRLGDNIKMDLRNIALEGVDWIHPAERENCGGLL